MHLKKEYNRGTYNVKHKLPVRKSPPPEYECEKSEKEEQPIMEKQLKDKQDGNLPTRLDCFQLK